jgi:hypothetical protein
MWGNLREEDHLEDLGLYGRILKWTLKKWVGTTWTGLVWFKVGTIEGGNECSGFIKCGGFLD